jgi:hypothetical protein
MEKNLQHRGFITNNGVEVKDLTFCPDCGKEIGLLEIEYSWLDKKNDIAVHDKCLEEIKKNNSKNKKNPFGKD